MNKHHPFQKAGGDCTPFREVHVTKSLEIANDLGNIIASFEIDDVPKKICIGNATRFARMANAYGELLATSKDALTALIDEVAADAGSDKHPVVVGHARIADKLEAAIARAEWALEPTVSDVKEPKEELYEYRLIDREGTLETCKAQTLDQAFLKLFQGEEGQWNIVNWFKGMALVECRQRQKQFGIVWEAV
jgi:hypothetical protein